MLSLKHTIATAITNGSDVDTAKDQWIKDRLLLKKKSKYTLPTLLYTTLFKQTLRFKK